MASLSIGTENVLLLNGAKWIGGLYSLLLVGCYQETTDGFIKRLGLCSLLYNVLKSDKDEEMGSILINFTDDLSATWRMELEFRTILTREKRL